MSEQRKRFKGVFKLVEAQIRGAQPNIKETINNMYVGLGYDEKHAKSRAKAVYNYCIRKIRKEQKNETT